MQKNQQHVRHSPLTNTVSASENVSLVHLLESFYFLLQLPVLHGADLYAFLQSFHILLLL